MCLQPDEIEDFVRGTLAEQGMYVVGDEGREIGICPFISFYIYNTPEDFVLLCQKVISVFDEFESKIIDEPFKLMTKGRDHEWLPRGHAKLPVDLMPIITEARADGDRIFIAATDMDSPQESARWAFDAVISDGIGHRYTRVKLTFRNRWYRKHQAKWHEFVERCIQQLQPDQCYSSLEVGNGGFNIMGAYECDVLERISADHFFGMDIDHPAPMSFHNFNYDDGYVDDVSLAGGIRTPTWCFLLSPYWISRLGRTEAEIRADLGDQRITVSSIPYDASKVYPQGGSALWIRLGELDLYPVEAGVPFLPVVANRLVRPIRCDKLQLLTLAPWDGDPNPRFDYQDSLRWMRRFDDDSDWPDARRRNALPLPDGPGTGASQRRALPGEPAPQTGWWLSIALDGDLGRVHRHAGELLPGPVFTSRGQVVWMFDTNQADS